MLHIVKQYRKMFLNLVQSNFEWSTPYDKNDDKLLNSTEMSELIKALKEKNALLSSEVERNYDVTNLKSDLNRAEVLNYITTKAKEYKVSLDWIVVEYNSSVAKVQSETKAKLEAIEVKTMEETDTSMEINFGTWKTDFVGLRENINYSSYEEVLKNLTFSQIKEFINSIWAIATKNNSNDKGGFYFTPFNIGDLKKEFTKIWYKADGVFWGIEMGSLFELFRNVYKTQEKLNKSTKFTDKLWVIFDYNQDGLLDNNVNFYTKEKQFFQAVKTESQFENLLKNLWYKSKEEFNLSFENNYFAARSEFKNRLGNVLSVKDVINPAEMLKNPKALQEFNETKLKAEVELERALNSNEKTKNLPKETKNAIKLQAVWLIAWSAVWAGASFDIAGVTNDIIDSLQIGIINWVPWIWIAKNIFKSKEGWFRVDVWAVNLIPMISASWVIKKAEYDEFKKLFPKEIDSKTQVTLTAAVSAVWSAVTLDFSNANEKTKLGIEKAKEKMSGVLDKVFDEIKSWKTFEQSSFKEDSSNKAVYEGLTWLYKSNGSNPELVKYLKEGSLKNYERALYQNADWLNYSWVSVWLLLLAWYLPVPLVLVQWDYHKTEWKRVLPAGSVEESKIEEKTDTSKQVEPTPAKTVRENLRSDFEKGTDIDSKLSSFESAFSYRTRFNKGALAFMSPEGSLESRWNWLLQLSRWVKALRDVKLNDFLTTAKTDNEKWLVISTISQYMKKANDFNNGDINSWNDNVDKYVKTDKDRRKAFDTMMWFSLESEAEQYYTKLKEAKGNIGETKIKWVWFDATASKNVETNKTVKWMDTLYTNLSILTVNGEPLLIPITDNAKIEAFKETIKSSKNISEDVKSSLIRWIESGSVELKFYKDPEGFDDRILPVIKRTIPGIDKLTDKTVQKNKTPEPQDSSVVEVFQPEHSTIKIVGWYAWERKEKPLDKPSWSWWDWLESKPGEERIPNNSPSNPAPNPAAPGTWNTEIPAWWTNWGFWG